MARFSHAKTASAKVSPVAGRRSRRKRQLGGEPSSSHPLGRLQRTIGNRAVGRLIRAKLKIGQPGDRYEREADRIAERVVNMPDSQINPAAALSVKPAPLQRARLQFQGELRRQAAEEEEIQRQPEEEELQLQPAEEEEMQRQAAEEEEPLQASGDSGSNAPAVTPAAQAGIHNLPGGNPLSPALRAFFEPRFGADFRGVRVHTDSQAADTAKSLNARAFTLGREVVFGAGEYSPATTQGKKLLAHELTHVVQQGRANSPSRNSIQRRLFVSGGNEAEVREYLGLVGDAAGFRLNWAFANPRVRVAGDTPGGPTSQNARRMLRQVINDPRQHAELHIGTHQPRVGVGAFPAAPSTIQNIDIDDIRNLNAALPNQGTAKAFHEMMENYHSHAAVAPGFGPSHQVGIESESGVLEDLGIVGRRLGGGVAPLIIPAPAGQPVGPNITYQRSRQIFTHYFLDIIFRVTAGSPGGPGADFEIVAATRVPKVQVSQRTIDRFASGSNAVPPAGNVLLATTLADLNANAGSTLELEGFTDSVGSQAVNRRVGRQRAEAVRAWFIAQGINANRIAIVGRGEVNFVAPNNTADGRAQNRRVIMTVHR